MHKLTAVTIATCVFLAWLSGAPTIAQESPLPVWVPNGTCGGMVIAPDACHVVIMNTYIPLVVR